MVQDFNDRRRTWHFANNVTSGRGRDEERAENAGFGLEFSLCVAKRKEVYHLNLEIPGLGPGIVL